MRRLLTGLALVVMLVLVAAQSATTAVGVDSTALRAAVSTAGIQPHLVKFHEFGLESVAEFGHPTRVDGSVGFTRSVAYVEAQARAAGLAVTVQPFIFDRFEETATPVFTRTTPTPRNYVAGTDFNTMEYSGSGGVGRLLAEGAGPALDQRDRAGREP